MPATSRSSEMDMRVQRCAKHQGEPLTEFSLKYEKCMCLRCATMQHDNFTDFVPVSECVVTKREEANTLLCQISEFSKVARDFQKDRRKFVENLKVTEKHIRETVKRVKNKLNRHIDILENKLINNLTKLARDEKHIANNVLSEIQVLEAQLNGLKEHIHDINKRGNEVEIITAVVEKKKSFSKLRNDCVMPEDKIASKLLQFKLSPAITNFLEQVNDLGEIEFITDGNIVGSPDFKFVQATTASVRDSLNESKLTYYTGVGTLSHTPMSRLTPKDLYQRANGAITMRRPHVSEISYDMREVNRLGGEGSVVFTAEHDGPCALSGVAALESGWIVVCDAKHKCIQLVNRKSEILDDLVFHYTPCSIAQVSDNSFAISFAHKDFISLFQVSKYRLSHIKDVMISGRGGNYSLAFCKNKFAVCLKGEIRIVSNDDGSLLQTIPIKASSPQLAMSDGGTRIYMSDFKANSVMCMTDLGKHVWEYNRHHMQPCGLALDLNQLFVADMSGRVFILSTYGDLIKEITCGGQLRALSVDPTSGKVLLTQESKDKTRSRAVKIVSV